MGKSNLRKSNHIMKKTLTAVAVLCALSGATLAADVTLYGVIDTGFTYQHTEGGDDSFAMTSGSYAGPRFGFKGTEALGDNLTLGLFWKRVLTATSVCRVKTVRSLTANRRFISRATGALWASVVWVVFLRA